MHERIVVLGGGTGTFTVLSGLKRHPVDLSAIVTMSDNGGSTGILRDELGVLPPGDIRQSLVALSSGDDVLRRLFTYRFSQGSLSGHNFGNLFLSALEKITGDPLSAVREAQRILDVHGRVIPVSAQASNLFAELEDGSVIEGEHNIDEPAEPRAAIRRCFLSPQVQANPEAIQAILMADRIVMGPGDLYTSLVPVLLVDGIAQAIAKSPARRILIVNLMTKGGQTDGYTAKGFVDAVNAYIAPATVDIAIMNAAQAHVDLIRRYAEAGDKIVEDDFPELTREAYRVPLLADDVFQTVPGDRLKRSFLRHDPDKVAAAILAA